MDAITLGHDVKQFFVIDYKDDYVLYRGTLQDCEAVLEENYAGLMIVGYRDLTPGMIKTLDNLHQTPLSPQE